MFGHAGDLNIKGVEKALKHYRVVMIVTWVVLAGLCGMVALRCGLGLVAIGADDDLGVTVTVALTVLVVGVPLFMVLEMVLGVLLSHVCMGRFRRSGAILRLGYDARRLKKLDAEGIPVAASAREMYEFQRELRSFATTYREEHGFLV